MEDGKKKGVTINVTEAELETGINKMTKAVKDSANQIFDTIVKRDCNPLVFGIALNRGSGASSLAETQLELIEKAFKKNRPDLREKVNFNRQSMKDSIEEFAYHCACNYAPGTHAFKVTHPKK